MTNLDNLGELTLDAIQDGFSWAYDFKAKKFVARESYSKLYLMMSLGFLALLVLMGLAWVALIGGASVTGILKNPVALLGVIGAGSLLALACIVAFVLFFNYFQMLFVTTALERKGYASNISGLKGVIDFTLMQALAMVAIAFSFQNRKGQLLLIATLVSVLLILVSPLFIGLAILLGGAYCLVTMYNGARLAWCSFHWFASGGKLGKRESVRKTWTWMGGRTLKSFIAVFATLVVTGIVLKIAFIPLEIIQFLVGLVDSSKLFGLVITALELPAQALTSAYAMTSLFAALAKETKAGVGKSAPNRKR